MKRFFTFLSTLLLAITLWAAGPIGQVKVRIQVPSSIGYKGTNLFLYWQRDDETFTGNAQMTAQSDRWFEATIDIDSPDYVEVYVSNSLQTSAPTSDPHFFIDSNEDVCKRLTNNYDLVGYNIEDLMADECNAKDYDYRAIGGTCSADPGKVHYNWVCTELAPAYIVYVDGDEYTVNKPNFTWYSCSETATTAPDIRVVPTNESHMILGDDYTVGCGREVPASPYFPQNIKVTDNKNNTYTITWDAVQDVEYYNFDLYVDGSYVYENKYARNITSFTTEPITDKSEHTYTINVRSSDGILMAASKVNIKPSTIYGLGDATVKILIPTDCGFDVNEKIFARWTDSKNTEGTVVELTQDADRWFHFSIEGIEDPFINVTLSNSNDFDKATRYSQNFKAYQDQCYEVQFSSVGGNDVNVADCNAADHNYKPYNLAVSTATKGCAIFTWEVKDETAGYMLIMIDENGKYYNIPATKSGYTLAAYDEDLVVKEWYVSARQNLEYHFTALGESDHQTDGFTLAKSSATPTNLKVNIAEQHLVAFTWDEVASASAYRIELYDDSYFEKLSFADRTTEANYQKDFKVDYAHYYWKVFSLDADGNPIGQAEGEDFNVEGEGYKVTDLEALGNGHTFLFTWKSNAPASYLVVTDYTVNILAIYTESKSFSYTFKESGNYSWSIYPAEKNSEGDYYFYNHSFYGGGLNIYDSADKYYTLQITAGEGGTVDKQTDNYKEGTSVTITAKPNKGMKFASWSDGDKTNPRTIKMDKDYNLTAQFAKAAKVTVMFTISPTAGGVVSANNKMVENGEEMLAYEQEKIELVAMGKTGYEFKQYTIGEDVITDSRYTLVVGKEDIEVIAKFKERETEPAEDGLILIEDTDISIMVENLSINITSSLDIDCTLYNMAGQVIGNKQANDITFQVPNAGLYILRIGQTVRKVVVK